MKLVRREPRTLPARDDGILSGYAAFAAVLEIRATLRLVAIDGDTVTLRMDGKDTRVRVGEEIKLDLRGEVTPDKEAPF